MYLLRFVKLGFLQRSNVTRSMRQMSTWIKYSTYDEEARENQNTFKASFQRFTNEVMSLEKDKFENIYYNHFQKVLDYNMTHGKCFRGNAVSQSYKLLQPNRKMTQDEIFRFDILGWCCELIHTNIIVADDMIDNSPMRRRRKTWHNVEGIGLLAINDALSLYTLIGQLLRKCFANHPQYVEFQEFFNEYMWAVLIGQTIDVLVSAKDKKRESAFENFTMENYLNVSKHKTATTVHYPLELMLRANGLFIPEISEQCKEITLDAGYIFQMQNDGTDVYGELSDSGKPSTDIQQGACTFFIVTALERGNEKQIKIIKENYGKQDSESARKVMEVFNELKLRQLYADTTRGLFQKIIKRSEEPSFKIPTKVIRSYINLYYKDTEA